MDVALGHPTKLLMEGRITVLILVVMDVALGHWIFYLIS